MLKFLRNLNLNTYNNVDDLTLRRNFVNKLLSLLLLLLINLDVLKAATFRNKKGQKLS